MHCKQSGAVVPSSFNDMGVAIRRTYLKLVKEGAIIESPEPTPPQMPVDYVWARKLGLIRKPSSFMSSISDERGQELVLAFSSPPLVTLHPVHRS